MVFRIYDLLSYASALEILQMLLFAKLQYLLLSYQNLFRLENFFILSLVNANGNSAPKYCCNVTLLYLSVNVNVQASESLYLS